MFKLIIKEQFEIGLPLIKAEFTMLDPTTYTLMGEPLTSTKFRLLIYINTCMLCCKSDIIFE